MDINLFLKLAAKFPREDLGCRPGATNGNRGLVLWYIDARSVMERLDNVLGPANWQDEYVPLEGGSVMCKLSIRVPPAEEWITKSDVGGESDQKDGGDRMKSAFSDALKRAAVKFGVGRYLYNIPHRWAEIDPHKKTFVKEPVLADDFLPPPEAVGEAKGVLLKALAERGGVKESEVLGYLRVKAWSEIPEEKYAWVLDRLKKRANDVGVKP